MSAPTTERRTRTATRPAAPAIPAQRTASLPLPASAAERAYARREVRTRRVARPADRSAAPAGRAQFVLLVMALLGIGLIASLWLSTAAAADSYRLQDARTDARTLSEQTERLRREVAAMQAPPALARRAAELGMVPAVDPARLVVAADGSVQVVGEPVAATATAPPPAPAVPGTPGAPAPLTLQPRAATAAPVVEAAGDPGDAPASAAAAAASAAEVIAEAEEQRKEQEAREAAEAREQEEGAAAAEGGADTTAEASSSRTAEPTGTRAARATGEAAATSAARTTGSDGAAADD